MQVLKYELSKKEDWDQFVKKSKNGTFLFERDFMDYHADRFDDHSLIIYRKNKIIALLPANQCDDVLYSHLGLSYGGVVVGSDMRAHMMMDIFDVIISYLRNANIKDFFYKCTPHIYHQQPAEEDLYALFRHGAVLYRRDVSTVVSKTDGVVGFSKGAKYNIKKALRESVRFSELDGLKEFHILLQEVLLKHNAKPVHSIKELEILKKRFPENVKLYGAFEESRLIAGALIFDTGRVAHTQYLASSDRGREVGALDLVISTLLQDKYKDRAYFSFGPSTEREGRFLNEGLIRQKEGFGGRSIVHDFYKLSIV